MSDIATAYLRQNVFGIGQSTKYVLLTLANYADANNECFPGIERLANELEMGTRTVLRHIKTLRELGLLESTSRYRACVDPQCQKPEGHAHRTSNYYRLILKPVDLRTVQVEVCGDGGSSNERVASDCGKPIDAKLAHMSETLENQRKRHRCQNGTNDPIGAKSVHPYVPPVAHMPIGNELSDLESPDQTWVDPGSDQGVEDFSPGQVGTPDGAGSAEVALSEAELAALGECVPPVLQAMDAASAKVVAGLCLERLAAGWHAFEIRRVLDRPLPDDVGHLGGLVAYRLRVNVSVDTAPSVLRERAEGVRREREAVLKQQAHDGAEQWRPDPVFAEFMANVDRRFPDLSGAEKARMWLSYSREVLEATHV